MPVEGNRISHVCLIADDMEHDAIIGYDILKRGGYTVNFSGPVTRGKRQSTRITVNHNVEVAAHSRKLLSLRPEQQFDQCLEARIQPVRLAVHNVWISDSICDIDSQGRVLLEVTNDNPFAVQLGRKTCLAEAKSYPYHRPKGDRTIRDWLTEKTSDDRTNPTGEHMPDPGAARATPVLFARSGRSRLNQGQEDLPTNRHPDPDPQAAGGGTPNSDPVPGELLIGR